MKIERIPDSVFIYSVLFEDAYDSSYRIRSYNFFDYSRLKPGKYHLILVTRNYQYLEISDIEIKQDGVMCINATPVYNNYNNFIASLPSRYEAEEEKRRPKNKTDIVSGNKSVTQLNGMSIPNGIGTISGIVRDSKGGEPIAFATISLKGYSTRVKGEADGHKPVCFYTPCQIIGKCIMD